MRSAALIGLVALAACEPNQPAAPDAMQSEAHSSTQPGQPTSTGVPTPESPTTPVNIDTFVALGTEPFWSATTAPSNVTYSTPEIQAGTAIAVVESRDGTARVYSGKLTGQPFVLRIAKGECSDGMSDTVYTYTASLTVSGEDRRGCARRK